jgi:hypothetical protein
MQTQYYKHYTIVKHLDKKFSNIINNKLKYFKNLSQKI